VTSIANLFTICHACPQAIIRLSIPGSTMAQGQHNFKEISSGGAVRHKCASQGISLTVDALDVMFARLCPKPSPNLWNYE